jgi:DNA-directed RNA polymerase subunit RPC12/RpoP
MNLKKVLGTILVSVLFFLGIIFAFASVYAISRLIVSALFFVVGFVIIYYVTRKPKVNIQRLEFSGQMKAVSLKCPNCSASIKSDAIKIVSGVPYATCDYCGHTFEMVEEPKW